MSEPFDPASHDAPSAKTSSVAALFQLTTDSVAPNKRFELWRDTALRRMAPVRFANIGVPFNGRLRRLSGNGAELIDHATDAMWADRPQQRCSADGCDDISIDLMLGCNEAAMVHNGESQVRPGDMFVIDYSRPVHVKRSRHRSLALMLNRRMVTEVLGDDLSGLSGARLPIHGISNLLRSHMRSTGDEATRLSPVEQAIAIDAAARMALAALQSAVKGVNDVDQVAEGLYIAACAAIARHCANPEFTPDAVASIVACSRASLYRLFSRHGKSVSAAIWTSRLERARTMLIEAPHRQLSIAEISFRCGFLDQSNFSRMFKRHYGITPRDVREMSRGLDL